MPAVRVGRARLPPSKVVRPIAAVRERSGLFGAVRGGGLDILKAQRTKIKPRLAFDQMV